MKKKIYQFTNIAPHYRSNLWEKLIQDDEIDVLFFYGTNSKLGIKEIDFSSELFKNSAGKLNRIRNIWIYKKILIWQRGILGVCLKNSIDLAIFLGEFQVLSTWIAVFICRLRGIKTAFWTHGLYGNESRLLTKLRTFFYNRADVVLTYEKRGKKLLIEQGIDASKIKVIYNSLHYDFHKHIRSKLKHSPVYQNYFKNQNKVLFFIGRLTEQKKISLLLESVSLLAKRGEYFNLVLVGTGNQSESLKNLAIQLGIMEQCWFYGPCYDEYKVAELIYNADLCVSPGNVGLTAIHSLSYGTPVCSHGNFINQMPEVESIVEGKTGCFFVENDSENLTHAISNWMETQKNRKEIRKHCYEVIDRYYNPNAQVEVLKSIV